MSYAKIHILQLADASIQASYISSWSNSYTIPYTKYNIKETDFRVKTASFTTPYFYDLTMGQYAILIHSKYHEDFSGLLLDVDYDEKTGLYTYQCQDWSRRYMDKAEFVYTNCKLYNILRSLITFNGVSAHKPTKTQIKNFKAVLSGLKAKDKYNQSLYDGNIYKSNPFDQSMSILVRDKTIIEVIRSLVFKSLGFFDVYFNSKGILQIKPISKTDWENTGLILTNKEYYDRKFKFSTTNAITSVNVTGSGLAMGDEISLKDINGMDLSVAFGTVSTSTSNPANSSNVSNATTSNKSNKKTTSKTNKYNNPFNNKPKKVWINADGGSNSMKNALAKELKKKGWKVHVGATYSNAHYTDYWKVSKDYSVYVTIYNGICAGTLREAYSSKIQNVLKKKGVQLCVVFDTASWNDPSRHLKKYKYGNFKGCSIKRAWDDNFSTGNVAIKDMDKFFRSNKARYCASPTASQVAKQFVAGGYYKYKGIKV